MAVNVLQSIDCSLWMFNPPTTLLSLGKSGVVKFPVKSRAPPISAKAEKEIALRSGLLSIWKRPPEEVSSGKVMLERAVLSSIVIPPVRPEKLPTEVRLAALREVK